MAITKSAKIEAEIEKVKAKIAEQQARLKELEQKKLEAENSEIVEIVRGMSVSLTDLPALLQTIKNGEEAVGNRTKVKVVKNKMAPPFKSAEFDVLYGEGISKEGSVLDMALQCNVVKKSGSWFTYDGDQLGQGRENVRKFLKDNPQITEEIGNKVKAEFGLIEVPDQLADGESATDGDAPETAPEDGAPAAAASPAA